MPCFEQGLDAMDYKEHLDYDLVESSNPDWGKCVVRVNVFKNHRQTVQYVQPQHYQKLAQAELLIIDEAAAIPLPLVKKMLGPYLVFLCSTVNGYEGTGRSLSLKLIQQLKEQGAKLQDAGTEGRTLREVKLQEPIRYAPGDRVERWLHELLCLDAAEHVPRPPVRMPHPDECELYYVNRDTLFSYHKASEVFLQRMMSLYVASHYKNTPNDLILMSDAPAHHLFALLGPVDEAQNAMPDVLCVVQVALEGSISKKAAQASLAQGTLPQGDLIPWTVGQQFQDAEFPGLSGARIVRIAVHPELGRAGYGSRAIQLLEKYYGGQIASLEEDEEDEDEARVRSNGKAGSRDADDGSKGSGLHDEKLKPRSSLPPLLVSLSDRKPERLQYLGVSFGLTQELFNFWHRAGFEPVYLRQTPSDVTGEHTAILLRPLEDPGTVEGREWIRPFVQDFKARLMALMSGAFRDFSPALALSLLEPRLTYTEQETQESVQVGVQVVRADHEPLTAYDLKRLQAYSNNLVDHHMILDLVAPLARAYFVGRLPATLSYGQAAILLCLGLQMKDVTAVEQALDLPSNQVLALFNKAMRKLFQHLKASKEAAIARTLPKAKDMSAAMLPTAEDLEAELDEAGRAIQEEMRQRLRVEDLQQFAIGSAADFEGALEGKLPGSGMVSIKSSGAGKQDGGAMLYKKDKKEGKDRKDGGKKRHDGGGKDRPGKKAKK